MSLTNAQAALQAAATVYGGGRGMTTRQAVVILADSFKLWLDQQDGRLRVQDTAGTQPTPRRHAQDENHNGDPVCVCGWNPSRHYRNLNGREAARGLIQQHVQESGPGTSYHPPAPTDGPLEGPPRPATRLTGHPFDCP